MSKGERPPCPKCGLTHMNGVEGVACLLTPLSESEAEQERRKEAYKKNFVLEVEDHAQLD